MDLGLLILILILLLCLSLFICFALMGAGCSGSEFVPSPLVPLHFLVLSSSDLSPASFNTLISAPSAGFSPLDYFPPALRSASSLSRFLLSFLSSGHWLASSKIFHSPPSAASLSLSLSHSVSVSASGSSALVHSPSFDTFDSPVFSFVCDSRPVAVQFHSFAHSRSDVAWAPNEDSFARGLRGFPRLSGVIIFIPMDFAPQAAHLLITEYRPLMRCVLGAINGVGEDAPFVIAGLEGINENTEAEQNAAISPARVSLDVGQALALDTGALHYLPVHVGNGRHLDELMFALLKEINNKHKTQTESEQQSGIGNK